MIKKPIREKISLGQNTESANGINAVSELRPGMIFDYYDLPGIELRVETILKETIKMIRFQLTNMNNGKTFPMRLRKTTTVDIHP